MLKISQKNRLKIDELKNHQSYGVNPKSVAHKLINTRDLMKENEHWRIFQWALNFKNKKILFEENSH